MAILKTTVQFDQGSGKIRTEQSTLAWADESALPKAVEANVIGLYPDYTFQTVQGWGCAMTEASCYLLSQMQPEERRAALAKCDPVRGEALADMLQETKG